MNTLAIVLLPAGMTLIAVTITLGTYEKHLRFEPQDVDTVRFVRQLGLCNVVSANVVASVLILLCARYSALTVVTAVICGLAGSGTVPRCGSGPSLSRRSDRSDPSGAAVVRLFVRRLIEAGLSFGLSCPRLWPSASV